MLCMQFEHRVFLKVGVNIGQKRVARAGFVVVGVGARHVSACQVLCAASWSGVEREPGQALSENTPHQLCAMFHVAQGCALIACWVFDGGRCCDSWPVPGLLRA
eukprot:TRINITY_DN4845_c0_g1_i3.p3 TRINITY_DN4845_c0_g1~~TRINITY_DN4845_c0_g1_i3.p3  ORF type:complete len:104 (-),score=3.98 TRINITY_DN4845_c0_g1_i3:325-636(-)